MDKEEGLNSEERMYLKHFLNHIQFQTSVPSEGDKEFVAKQYYEGTLYVDTCAYCTTVMVPSSYGEPFS